MKRKTPPKQKKKKISQRKRKVSFRKIISAARKAMVKSKDSSKVIKSALEGARAAVKSAGGRQHIQIPRVLPIANRVGGALPLIPLFAAAGALGSLIGGASGVMRAVNDASNAKKQLEESTRHNKTVEAIALGKGLHLQPYKNGMGLYLTPKNFH